MARMIGNVVLVASTVVLGLYGAYLFLIMENPSVGDLMNFAPCAVFGMMAILFNVFWHLEHYEWMNWMTQMDPVTAVFIIVILVFATLGYLSSEQQKTRECFAIAGGLFTFLAGFEAGKQKEARRKATAKPTGG